ncbi:hypothetical protein KR074_008253 [Drosophila pseudoananassae]|nr:hypothetical protein KR074_008253 [Drosophila pseudoananassae]
MECNLGSEIGQKMRSAVKAKLLELGTGGSSGFIDDELPDYVMVMVANKRTKQQMNAELNLFLGDQTDLFVTWLHEVLQKLQEVTLPTSSASSKKRKSKGQGEASKPKEKDKKSSKKEKRPNRKSGDELQEPQSSSADAMPVITSITDVFAEELLEKAKKNLDIGEMIPKKKNRKSIEEEEEEPPAREPDIPAPSEISSTTSGLNRQKDLAELAEIQKKIHAAKKHLRQIGEIEDESEEEDDDLLNLSAQEDAVDQEPMEEPFQKDLPPRRVKSPIVFNRKEKTPEKPPESEPEIDSRQEASTPEEDQPSKEDRAERRSVHDRLGTKAMESRSSQRNQKELYVPAHRRKSEPESSRDRSQRERSKDRSRDRSKDRRDTSRDTSRKRRSPSPNAAKPKQRIGSRVIVAVRKPPEPSDDEDIAEKPVNSVIKIKPRPQVSPRRQACKNLLLRAVADAQRSTILAKTSSRRESEETEKISSSLGKRKATGKAERERERERDRSKRTAPNNELFRRSTRELVVNVTQRGESKRPRRSNESHAEIKVVQEEYTPSPNAEEFENFVPQLIEDIDLHINTHDESLKTQFVVTLNGDQAIGGGSKPSSSSRKRQSDSRRRDTSSPVSTAQVSSSSTEPTSTTTERRHRSNPRERSRSPNSASPSLQSSRNINRSEVLRQPQEIKKIIIKNDTDEDDEMNGSPRKRTASKRQQTGATNPANGHRDNRANAPDEARSTTPPLPANMRPEKRAASKERSTKTSSNPRTGEEQVATSSTVASTSTKSKHTPIRFTLKNEEEPSSTKKRRPDSRERDGVTVEKRRIPIRNAEDRKYDNLPALSAVSVDSTVLKVNKPKERCKYHPNCTKQFCEYYHPSAPCKSFPNCKFADKCMYSHPKCKFDMSCMSIDCNYAHSGQRDLSHVQLTAPPLSSHVIPVQNYKSISAPVTSTTATTMCKYYPNCSKIGCTFYHPKPCRFGKNCVNKLECIFYHPEMQSKFKWVASMG